MTRFRRMHKLQSIIESGTFQNFIITVIVINAITIGLETWPSAINIAGGLLFVVDRAALAIFVAEILAKLVVYRLRFFPCRLERF